jgi:hypothetical protein
MEILGKQGGIPAEVAPSQEMYVFDASSHPEIDAWQFDRNGIGLKLLLWSIEFSGKVPKAWGERWYRITADLENLDTVLTSTQVEAALVYPISHVPRALGERVKLDRDQLAMLAVVSPGVVRDIVEVQRKKFGVIDGVEFALEIARRRLTDMVTDGRI